MTPSQKNMRGQAGFTLVELAIVMIIIGLLIAGVLKGQALIGNAKVTAQVAQVKSIERDNVDVQGHVCRFAGGFAQRDEPSSQLRWRTL